LALYRIAAGAEQCLAPRPSSTAASVELPEAEIRLEISDDGIGFQMPRQPTDLAPSGHFGLLGMRERADLIGARLEVHSQPGRGTRISVRLSVTPTVETAQADSHI
jgi:signal transduction histidine kinase